MIQHDNNDLATEKNGKPMGKYAVPCVISLVVAALYNIVDQIIIANADALGSYSNAANTVVFPLTVVALAIAVMIGDGCCASVSIRLGKKQTEAAGGVDYDMPVLLGYTGLSDVLLQKYVADSAFLWEGKVEELQMTQVGSVVGTHAGPGAIVATFFRARH